MAQQAKEKGPREQLSAALRAVAQQADPEGRQIHRVSLRMLGDGEVVYRLHTRDDDAVLGGTIRP